MTKDWAEQKSYEQKSYEQKSYAIISVTRHCGDVDDSAEDRIDQGSNPWPQGHGHSTFHVPEMLVLTTEPSGTV